LQDEDKVEYNIDYKIRDVLDIFGNIKGFATERTLKELISNEFYDDL